MTDYQNELVMEHLDLVNWVIRTRISVPNRPLLTYDDFYAIGCEAICRAALKYQVDTDLDRYMCHTYAFVDRNGDWTGSGDMGWFGISSNDKDERAWNDEIQKLMNEAKDDDFLAIVDCHI